MSKETLEYLVAQVTEQLAHGPLFVIGGRVTIEQWANERARNIVAGLSPFLCELPEGSTPAGAPPVDEGIKCSFCKGCGFVHGEPCVACAGRGHQ